MTISQQLVAQLAWPLVLLMLGGLGLVLAWLYAKFAASGSRSQQVAAQFVHLAQAVVLNLQTKEGKMLADDLADGKLDATELAALKAQALVDLKQMAGDAGLKMLQSVMGIVMPASIDKYLGGLIALAFTELQKKLGVYQPDPSPAPAPAATQTVTVKTSP